MFKRRLGFPEFLPPIDSMMEEDLETEEKMKWKDGREVIEKYWMARLHTKNLHVTNIQPFFWLL